MRPHDLCCKGTPDAGVPWTEVQHTSVSGGLQCFLALLLQGIKQHSKQGRSCSEADERHAVTVASPQHGNLLLRH